MGQSNMSKSYLNSTKPDHPEYQPPRDYSSGKIGCLGIVIIASAILLYIGECPTKIQPENRLTTTTQQLENTVDTLP